MDKKILITGASRGLGKDLVEELASRGWTVYATMRSPEKFLGYDTSGDIRIESLDVTNPEEVQKVVGTKELDALINNAGYGLYCPVELIDEEEMLEQFDVNLFGVIRVMQAAVPSMRKRGGGRIINISSIAALSNHRYLGLYAATKSALEQVSLAMQANLLEDNIFISCIEMGRTATEFAKSVKIGKRCDEKSPYEPDFSTSLHALDDSLQQGQDPREVAKLIAEILEAEHPDFRYQSSERIKEIASLFIQDLSGNRWLDEERKRLEI